MVRHCTYKYSCVFWLLFLDHWSTVVLSSMLVKYIKFFRFTSVNFCLSFLYLPFFYLAFICAFVFFLTLFLLHISYNFSLVFLLPKWVLHTVWSIVPAFNFQCLFSSFTSKNTFVYLHSKTQFIFIHVLLAILHIIYVMYTFIRGVKLFVSLLWNPYSKTEDKKHSQLLSNPEGNNFIFFSVVGAIFYI